MITWNPVDGPERPEHPDRPDGAQVKFLHVEAVLQSTGGEDRGGGGGQPGTQQYAAFTKLLDFLDLWKPCNKQVIT